MNRLSKVSEVVARRTVEDTFKKAINDLTVYETGKTEIKIHQFKKNTTINGILHAKKSVSILFQETG